MALFTRLLGFVLVGIFGLFVSLTYLVLTTFINLLPGLLNLLRFLLQVFLRLSYRGYHQILRSISPMIYQHFGYDAFNIPTRAILSLLFSLIIGFPFILLAGMSWVWWILGFSSVHGLIVGIRWEQLESPDGLQLGVKT